MVHFIKYEKYVEYLLENFDILFPPINLNFMDKTIVRLAWRPDIAVFFSGLPAF